MKKIFKIEKLNFALYGFLFGSLFPLSGTLLQCNLNFSEITIKNIISVQQKVPLLWIIDTAPLWLGIFAMFAGIQLDKINAYNNYLKHEVKEKTAELEDEYKREKQLIIEKTDAILEAEESKMKIEKLEKESV